ncbi:MAG: polymorphic toxin type 17 domain-containing protein [Tepidisphaeraceae bacterium]
MSQTDPTGLSPEALLRSLHLPTAGEFPFIPPKRWRPTQPLHGPSTGGYYDRFARLWKKGRSITRGQHFEWDVQFPSGSHLNVDWTGRITHPRASAPKTRRAKRDPGKNR